MLYSHGSTRITNHSLLLKKITSSQKHIIYFCFEILVQEFDTLFEFTSQEGPILNIPKINIIQLKYIISIDQAYHIMTNIIQ